MRLLKRLGRLSQLPPAGTAAGRSFLLRIDCVRKKVRIESHDVRRLAIALFVFMIDGRSFDCASKLRIVIKPHVSNRTICDAFAIALLF